MTSQPPTDFENYPGRAEADGVSDPAGSQPPAGSTPTVRPYQAAPVSAPPPSGFSRRGVIGVLIGIPVAVGFGAVVLNSNSNSTVSVPSGEWTEIEGEDDDEATSFTVGDYAAAIPDTWESVPAKGHATAFARGDNRLLGLALTDDGSRDVTDWLQALAEQYRGPFKGRLGEPTDTSSSTSRRATLTAEGSYAGKGARLRADLWIDSDDQALLVIQTLTARKGSTIAVEAQSMADELSGNF